MKTISLRIGYALPLVPKTLQEFSKEILDHYLVNACHEFAIKTPAELINEFYKSRSPLLDSLESVEINILKDILVEWDILSPTHCILLQNNPPSLN